MRRILIPLLVGFAILYVILLLVAHWMLFSARLSDTPNSLAIWSLMLVALVSVSVWVAREAKLKWSRALIAAVFSTAALVALILAAIEAISLMHLELILVDLGTPLAQAIEVFVLTAALVGITVGVIRFGRPSPHHSA
jgi:hypothetical protein